MPSIPLFKPGSPPQLPVQSAPPALTETGRALQELGRTVTGVGEQIHQIEAEKKKQRDLIVASDLAAEFDRRLSEIEAEEQKLPLTERDSFRVKSMNKVEQDLLNKAAGQSDFTYDLVRRSFPGRKSQFLSSAYTRDAKNEHDTNRAAFDQNIRSMSESAIESPDEMFEQRLLEIGAFVDEATARGIITPREGEKYLAETGRDIRNNRHRSRMLVEPYNAYDLVKADKELLEVDRHALLKEALGEQQRQISLWQQLQNQHEAAEKRRADDAEKDLLAQMFQDPSHVLKAVETPDVNRTLGFSRTKRLRDLAVYLVQQGRDPVQSDIRTYWKFRNRVREADSGYELDLVMDDLASEPTLTRGDRIDIFNRMQQRRDKVHELEKDSFENEKKRATKFLKQMFKVTGEFMPDPTGQGVEVMVERMEARLSEDPKLNPVQVAQDIAIEQAKLLGNNTKGFQALMGSLKYQNSADVMDAWARNEIGAEEKEVLITIFAIAYSLGLKHPGQIVDQQPSGSSKTPRRSSGRTSSFRE